MRQTTWQWRNVEDLRARFQARASALKRAWRRAAGRDRSEALRAGDGSESIFQRLAERAPDIIFRYRLKPQFSLEYVNAAVEPTFGYKPSDLYGTNNPWFIVHPDDAAFVEEVVRHPERFPIEPVTHRVLARDGRLVWVEARFAPVLDDAGELVALEGIARDVTALKLAEQEVCRLSAALQERESRLRRLFDVCPIAVTMTDVEGRLLYANPAMGRIAHLTPAQLFGQRSLDLVHPDDRARVLEWRRELIGCGSQGAEITFRIVPTAGERRLRVCASAMLAGTRAEGLVSTVEDVTERLQFEERLRQSQKMEAVGQLAGGIAHDFNNLLTVILHGTFLLSSHLAREHADVLAQIETAADRAARLTTQLLTFSRRHVLRMQAVDLTRLVNEQLTILKRLLGERYELRATLEPGEALVSVDPNLIELVLLNLVLNARDAMPDGGAVTIGLAAARGHAPPRAVAEHPGRRYLRLTVQDTGSGIASEHLPHIFEPFYTTKEPGKGSGLGLASVYGVVEQHGGFIEVDTALGRGTTFHVYLPELAGAAPSQRAAPVEASRGGGESILLVEDEDAVRQMLRVALEGVGYHVIEAENADAALTAWSAHAPRIRLLLTDIVMPGRMSGRDLARALRAEHPELPVVFMSGYGAHEIVNEPRSAFVQKPFAIHALADVVRTQLGA